MDDILNTLKSMRYYLLNTKGFSKADVTVSMSNSSLDQIYVMITASDDFLKSHYDPSKTRFETSAWCETRDQLRAGLQDEVWPAIMKLDSRKGREIMRAQEKLAEALEGTEMLHDLEVQHVRERLRMLQEDLGSKLLVYRGDVVNAVEAVQEYEAVKHDESSGSSEDDELSFRRRTQLEDEADEIPF